MKLIKIPKCFDRNLQLTIDDIDPFWRAINEYDNSIWAATPDTLWNVYYSRIILREIISIL